jgi:Nif-specific regulatory protein
MSAKKGSLSFVSEDGEVFLTIPTGSNVVIGRRDSADIIVAEPTFAGEHARVRETDSGWIIEDLGSTSGTSVNQEITIRTPVQLFDGDKVRMGRLWFRVKIEQ